MNTTHSAPAPSPALSTRSSSPWRSRGRRLAVTCVAVAAGLSLAGGAAAAPDLAHRPPTAPTGSTPLKQAAKDVVAAGAVGYVTRVDDGRRVTKLAVGLADRSTGRKLRTGDQFEIGSNTKTFVAALVLQLVGEGRVSLSAPVEKYLPGVVPNGKNITVRMLLQHTSGLYNYTADEEFFESVMTDPKRVWTPEELLAVAFKHDPDFPPGADWNYSNTNYTLAGLLLEKVTGKQLPDLIQKRIARPLGLHRTYLADPVARHTGPGFAHGYVASFAGSEPTYTDVSDWPIGGWGGAAGGIISTSEELGRFFAGLMSGRVLRPAQLAEMKKTVAFPAEFPIAGGYGLGLMRQDSECGTVWRHGGDTIGHHSTAYVTADGSRTAVSDTTTQPNDLDGAVPGAVNLAKAGQRAELVQICTMLGKPVPAATATTP